jgi:hypothetical protein
MKAGELKNTVSSLKQVKSTKSKTLNKEIEGILRANKIKSTTAAKTFAIQLPDLVRRGNKSVRSPKASPSIDLKYSVYSSAKKMKINGLTIKKRRVLILRELNGQIVEQKLVVSK